MFFGFLVFLVLGVVDKLFLFIFEKKSLFFCCVFAFVIIINTIIENNYANEECAHNTTNKTTRK